MSNIYIQEPPTNGKIIMKTTSGDIEIELWPKEAPKACRNFVQLCMEGYYNNTIFHRVVPGFIVQGGDPTGTGEGGESIYGEPFGVEVHSRLRFVRRGLLAMATNESKEIASQFFFTLGSTPELQKKNTIFGTIVGDSIYNAMKIVEGEVDKETERPLYPKKIISTTLVVNPYTDIVPRMTADQLKLMQTRQNKPTSKPLKNKKAFKQLLSFGDGEEFVTSNELVLKKSKIASIYDLGDTEQQPKSEKKGGRAVAKLKPPASSNAENKSNKKPENSNFVEKRKDIAPSECSSRNTDDIEIGQALNFRNDKSKNERLQRTDLTQEAPITKAFTAKPKDSDLDSAISTKESRKKSIFSGKALLSEQMAKYKSSKNSHKSKKDNEKMIFEKLGMFKEKLDKAPKTENPQLKIQPEIKPEELFKMDKDKASDSNSDSEPCKLHQLINCESCRKSRSQDFEVNSAGNRQDKDTNLWMKHKLNFKESASRESFTHKVADYVVIDPREQEKAFLKKRKSTR